VIVFVLVFEVENSEGTAGESVLEVVLAGCGFAGFGFGAGGVLRIRLIGGNLGFRGHGELLL
jgi:hypothetical protein